MEKYKKMEYYNHNFKTISQYLVLIKINNINQIHKVYLNLKSKKIIKIKIINRIIKNALYFDYLKNI